MYSILIKSENGNNPIVISQNNNNYPDYLSSGYEILFQGTKKDCNEIVNDLLTAYSD